MSDNDARMDRFSLRFADSSKRDVLRVLRNRAERDFA